MSNRKLTAQMLFDEVAGHLLAQGGRSVRPDGTCAYRGNDGLRCAVGAMILDHEYLHAMEGRTVGALVSKGLFPDRLMPYVNLLHYLQCVHDIGEPPGWPRRLGDVAVAFGLSTAVLVTA